MSTSNARLASSADVPALVWLINLAFQAESPFIKGDRTDEAGVHAKMKTGSFFVIAGDAGLNGCVYVETADASNAVVIARGEGAGYIGMLAVDPALQGRGLGKQLMRFAEEELRRRGCTRVQLRIVSLRTELIEFYGKFGYRETGTSPYPRPESLKKAAHFVNMEKSL